MATTITIPDSVSSADLSALMALLQERAANPSAPAPAPAPAKRTRKAAPASQPVAPAPVTAPAAKPAPVTATAPNGARVDITDPYRRMVAFTHRAIAVLRSAERASGNAKTKSSKGIHSVYSGFNQAFGEHFSLAKEQVWATVDMMVSRGDIQAHFCRGGKMLYLPGEMASGSRPDVASVLAKILG